MADREDVVAVVTGASRGVGKGIAIALGASGATVYVTGRSTDLGPKNSLGGTAEETARAVTNAGGRGVAVVCDHSVDGQVQSLFARIEQNEGRLDVLVNNVTTIPPDLARRGPFWRKGIEMLDILSVGMRSHYVASYYAAPMLLLTPGSLIAMTSSYGARCYMHGPAYGAGKAAVDKMAMDMAVDFRDHDVAVASLWLGFVRTERNEALFQHPDALEGPYGPFLKNYETPDFIGRVIIALRRDPERMQKSGRIHIVAELAAEYEITEADGRVPKSSRGQLGIPPEPWDVQIR